MARTVAPYGSWRSPITAERIVEGSASLGGPAFGGGDIWWSELRPTEKGRVQVVRKPLDAPPAAARDVLPDGFSARTRVHEYGGGAWWLHGETLFFANWSDQRLYRLDPGGGAGQDPVPLTPEPDAPHGLRYADGRVTGDGRWIVCVREWHGAPGATEARNQLVAIRTDGSGEPVVLVGADDDANPPDFVSNPRIGPDGAELRWLQWSHPDMPWDHTVVGSGALVERNGVLGLDADPVIDHAAGSLAQPDYGLDGVPYVVSDATGWWRLGVDTPAYAPVVRDRPGHECEWAQPQWVFGQSWYAFTADGRGIVAACRRDARDHLRWIEAGATGWGEPIALDVPFTSVDGVVAGPDGVVAFIGGSFTREPEVVTIDTAGAGSGEVPVTVHRPARDLGLAAGAISVPRHIRFDAPRVPGHGDDDYPDVDVAYGLFYPPANPGFEGPGGTAPPLVVLGHGGPTGAARPLLSLGVQFWTSRGFAVVDVNYRGSTGYGREFREALNGRWGISDVEDCIAAARHLAGEGLVDGDRLVIRGGSAGGFTTLRALTTSDAFAAGASHYGIADLGALARDTHKFESRYLDRLVGPYPDDAATYDERSPINHTDRLATPLIILQGLDDEVVPPAQAEMMVDALRERKVPHAYLTFEGEQHGFRQAASIRRALEAELYFYGRVLGFEPADDLEPVPIEFL